MRLQAEFVAADKAIKILQDPTQRNAYDAALERCRAADSPGHAVHDEVAVDELERREGPEGADLVMPCRCGDQFVLSEKEAACHIPVAFCEGCSLIIRVLYPT